jgi:hypothetical protein
MQLPVKSRIRAKCIAVGAGKILEDGKIRPLAVKVGDKRAVRQVLPARPSRSMAKSCSSCAKKTSWAWSRPDRLLRSESNRNISRSSEEWLLKEVTFR